MYPERLNYKSLNSIYLNSNSLQYKKLKIFDKSISEGSPLLDIGSGTGELIKSEINKFDEIYGIDADIKALNLYRTRINNEEKVHIIESDLQNLDTLFSNTKFSYITCLDVLEHIELKKCKLILHNIYNITKDCVLFIFTGPEIFDKIRISMGMSPTHLHSHSSYGWKKLVEEVGFNVLNMDTVEFPLINHYFLRKKLHLFGKFCIYYFKRKSNDIIKI